jgi:hypothetical protein
VHGWYALPPAADHPPTGFRKFSDLIHHRFTTSLVITL